MCCAIGCVPLSISALAPPAGWIQADGQHVLFTPCSAFTATAPACWQPSRPTGPNSSCKSHRRYGLWCGRSAASHGGVAEETGWCIRGLRPRRSQNKSDQPPCGHRSAPAAAAAAMPRAAFMLQTSLLTTGCGLTSAPLAARLMGGWCLDCSAEAAARQSRSAAAGDRAAAPAARSTARSSWQGLRPASAPPVSPTGTQPRGSAGPG